MTRQKQPIALESTWTIDVISTTFYLASLVLLLIPDYHWVYRLFVNALFRLLFWVTAVLAASRAIVCLTRRQRKSAVLALVLALFVLASASQAHRWRYAVTDSYIQRTQCDLDVPDEGQLILGGIQEIYVEGEERTGAFENASHCVFVQCKEEFYYCDEAKVAIEP